MQIDTSGQIHCHHAESRREWSTNSKKLQFHTHIVVTTCRL